MLYNTPLVPLYFGEKDRLEKRHLKIVRQGL